MEWSISADRVVSVVKPATVMALNDPQLLTVQNHLASASISLNLTQKNPICFVHTLTVAEKQPVTTCEYGMLAVPVLNLRLNVLPLV